MPFFSFAPTICLGVPLSIASNSVGEDPQSRSVPNVSGTVHFVWNVNEVLNRTIENESPESPLPTVIQTKFWSEAALVHTLAPIVPLGVVQ